MEDVNRRLRRRCRLGALDPAEADLGLRDGAALRRGDGGLDGLEPELESRGCAPGLAGAEGEG